MDGVIFVHNGQEEAMEKGTYSKSVVFNLCHAVDPQKFQARVVDPTAQGFNLSYSWLGQNMSY